MPSGDTLFFLIGGVGIGLFLGFLFAKLFFYQNVKKQRKQAVHLSKSVTLGYVHEKLAPILPNFPYNYKDLTFLGKGVDYIVFDGLSEGNLKKIVFLEIKSGKSRLNLNEKSIRDTINKNRVTHEIIRLSKRSTISRE